MKKTKLDELRAATKDELRQKERGLKEELLKINAQRYAGRVDKPHMFLSIRKDIARIETILKERQNKNG